MSEKILLVVEDDAIQREEVAKALQAQGHAVKTAADGRGALAYLQTGSVPDVILLDMMMEQPGCDGWSFLRQLRRLPQFASIPVLIVTGLGVATWEWAASLGAAGMLKKPFDVKTLLAEIGRVWTVHGTSPVASGQCRDAQVAAAKRKSGASSSSSRSA